MNNGAATVTTVSVLGTEYPARSYMADTGQVCDIDSRGAVQSAIEARVAHLITRIHADRSELFLPMARGPIQTAMAVQREITALYRVEGVSDSGSSSSYHGTGYTPADLADLLNDLDRRLESIVIRWMTQP